MPGSATYATPHMIPESEIYTPEPLTEEESLRVFEMMISTESGVASQSKIDVGFSFEINRVLRRWESETLLSVS